MTSRKTIWSIGFPVNIKPSEIAPSGKTQRNKFIKIL